MGQIGAHNHKGDEMSNESGKAFHTRKEAAVHLKRVKDGLERGHAWVTDDFIIRRMSKKHHPRRKKLFHVGTFIDFLNFA